MSGRNCSDAGRDFVAARPFARRNQQRGKYRAEENAYAGPEQALFDRVTNEEYSAERQREAANPDHPLCPEFFFQRGRCRLFGSRCDRWRLFWCSGGLGRCMLLLRLFDRRGRSFGGRCNNCGCDGLGCLAACSEFGDTVFKPAQSLAGAHLHYQGDNGNPGDNQIHLPPSRVDWQRQSNRA